MKATTDPESGKVPDSVGTVEYGDTELVSSEGTSLSTDTLRRAPWTLDFNEQRRGPGSSLRRIQEPLRPCTGDTMTSPRSLGALLLTLAAAVAVLGPVAIGSDGHCDWLGDPELIARCEAAVGAGHGGFPRSGSSTARDGRSRRSDLCPDGTPRILPSALPGSTVSCGTAPCATSTSASGSVPATWCPSHLPAPMAPLRCSAPTGSCPTSLTACTRWTASTWPPRSSGEHPKGPRFGTR